jgi:hypothetical protein
LTAMIGVAIVAGSPLLAEGTSDPCGALANAVVRQAMRNSPLKSNATDAERAGQAIGLGLVSLVGPAMARARVQQLFPNTPAPISCTVVWWDGMAEGFKLEQS